MTDTSKLLLALALFLGLLFNGYFIGRSIERFRKEDRSISVKGFAEREVKSNLVVWTLKNRIATNNLVDGSREIELSKAKVLRFLDEKGIAKADIIQQNLNVLDKLANMYSPQENNGYRFVIENIMQVRSLDVDKVQTVSRLTDELLKAGVSVAGMQEFPPTIQYFFTDLARIKPEMLSDATQNARKAAEEFAKQNDAKPGALKKASQGLFTIMERDDFNSSAGGEGGIYGNNQDIMKKIRVVVSVEYSVE